jgi:hypothetical protein
MGSRYFFKFHVLCQFFVFYARLCLAKVDGLKLFLMFDFRPWKIGATYGARMLQ